MSESLDFEVTNGVPLNEQLSFQARSCVVDNFTSSWIYVPAARRYVPPGGGAGLAFAGTQVGRIEWRTPPGKVAIPALPAEAADVSFSSSPTPEGSGITSATNVAGAATAPNQVSKFASPGGVGVQAIIAGAPGLQIFVFSGQLRASVAAAGGIGRLQDTTGVILALIGLDTIHETPYNLSGAPIPVGRGISLAVVGGGSVDASLAWSLSPA